VFDRKLDRPGAPGFEHRKSPETKAHGVLRRLAGRWLQILMLWLLISFVVMFLVHALVKPTYVAVSLLRVEPPDPDIFGPLERLSGDSRNLINLQTQTQPTLNKVTEEQFAKLIDKQVQCDLDYLDALAQLEAVKAVRERNEDKKESFAKQIEQVELIRAEVDQKPFDFTHVNNQLENLMHRENQVRKNLEQLKYEAAHQRNRVRILEEASASRTPKSGMLMRYMAAVSCFVLLLLLGAFLAHNIMTYRRAATLLD
jgi:hypothetical protein